MHKLVGQLVRLLSAGLLLNLIVAVSAPQQSIAAGVQQAECQIGFSSSCPALSAQEVYNLYGNTVDTPIWISSNATTSGTAIQVFAMMNHGSATNSGWILLMKGTKNSTNFGYSSSYFTSNTSVGSTDSLSNDVTNDAKFGAYNTYPLDRAVLAWSNPTYGALPVGGDIGSNIWNTWVWQQTGMYGTTMYSQLNGSQTLVSSGSYSSSTNPRQTLFMSGSNYVFGYETGYAEYGFNIGNCNSARWGIVFNNETDYTSCDVSVGIGLGAGNNSNTYAGNINMSNYNGISAAQNVSLSSPSYGALGSMGFQIWGRISDPAFGTPQNLTVTSPTPGQASLDWNAPAAGTVSEYVVQYKKNSDSDWSAARTFRVTGTAGSATALVTGLNQGTAYNFKVWARSSNDSSASALTGNLTVGTGALSNVSLNTTSPIYRALDTLTATVTSVGYATFFAQGKAIPGCKNIPTTSTSVSCSWLPSQVAFINLSVSYAPSALPAAISMSSLRVLVAPRASGSHKR
jgi:hypothetical protein